MGLITDPTSPEANSYVSLSEATLLLGRNPYTDSWDALGVDPSATGWVLDGSHSAGAAVLTIRDGIGVWTPIPVTIQLGGKFYDVQASTATTIDIAPVLAVNLGDGTGIRRVTYSKKEQFLLHSTKSLDAQVDWNGAKVFIDDPLRWPRANVIDCDRHLYNSDIFPDDLKELTAEYANYLAERNLAVPPGLVGLGFSRAKVDVIEVTVDMTQQLSMMPPYIKDLLGCMGVWKGNSVTGGKTMTLRRT